MTYQFTKIKSEAMKYDKIYWHTSENKTAYRMWALKQGNNVNLLFGLMFWSSNPGLATSCSSRYGLLDDLLLLDFITFTGFKRRSIFTLNESLSTAFIIRCGCFLPYDCANTWQKDFRKLKKGKIISYSYAYLSIICSPYKIGRTFRIPWRKPRFGWNQFKQRKR